MKLRHGFTLLELIVVVFIISLIYSLVFSNMQKRENKPKVLTPLNLKDNVFRLINGEGEFFCVSKCKECYYSQTNSTNIKRFKGKLALGELEVYILDSDDNFQRVEYGRVDDEKLCIRYNIYSNKSSSQIVIKNRDGVFYIPSYFGESKKVNDLDEAKEIWLKYSDNISSMGDFY